MIHELKTWPEFWAAVDSFKKNFEVRRNDRNFQVGDTLHLNEFTPCKHCKATGSKWSSTSSTGKAPCCDAPHGVLSSKSLWRYVSYTTVFYQKDGFIVMGLSTLPIEAEAPEVLYFGRLTGSSSGHALNSKKTHIRYEQTPWEKNLDGGLLAVAGMRSIENQGVIHEHHKDGWTAVAFWDRSGDSRPGSNSAFIIRQDIGVDELLALARIQWPEVYHRPGFPPLKRVVP